MGPTPVPGFAPIVEGRLWGVVRIGPLADALKGLLRAWARGSLPPGRPISGGRGGARRCEIGGQLVVVRECRRGGVPARFTRHLYVGLRPRPIDEAAVAERLRLKGVPVAEPLAAGVLWRAPLLYRGVLVTRDIPGARDLWEHLRTAPAEAQEEACRSAAAVVRRLHDAGGIHHDLNLRNILVREEDGRVRAWLVDFDRAELRAVSPRDRQRAVARICRSIRRLDPEAEIISLEAINALARIGCPGQEDE